MRGYMHEKAGVLANVVVLMRLLLLPLLLRL
jgi:hypothetical protein